MRLDLIQHCIGNDELIISKVVKYLMMINKFNSNLIFVTLLQSYVLHNTQYAYKYLHKNIHSLIDIQKFFSKVTSLRNLISSIPGPKEGTNGEIIFLIGQQKIITNESKYPQHWPNSIASLGKIQGEDVYLQLNINQHWINYKML
ncbi:hypothetical protein HCN44_003737 [Aphidius gifuensis]|uniref:Uncharacterized protein n=1 Tax=Aphidius gifuensis TaxID=684658 RepID=A0A835CM00_APHGI|nr:hypothetical protein HCN44_003737 [Aphidius gifuensis]